MEFEQAIYTRGNNLLFEPDLDIGLGIVASSKMDRQFVMQCKRIGGNFKSERTEETVQFVIYSEGFHSYVGVSLRPALNEDGGGANIECRIFVPAENEKGKAEERLGKPESYYIDYHSVNTFAVDGRLERVELPQGSSPVKRNCRNIINKYFTEPKKLAYFLYKMYPILFAEKRFLLILLDADQWKEELFTIAGEITSLANYLAPVNPDGGIEYRKRLSYSVNAEKNMGIASIAYSADESLSHENCLYLGKELDENIPEVYLALAQKATESVCKYQKFIDEILDDKAENITSKKMQEGYFWWKLSNEEKVPRNEIPFRIEELVEQAAKDQNEEKLFIKYILLADDLETGELRTIWDKFICPGFCDRPKSQEIIDLMEHMILQMYERSRKGYRHFLTDIPGDIQFDIMFRIFLRNDSCIRKHFETIQSFEEYWDALKLYNCLNSNEKYINYIQQCSFAREIPEGIRKDFFYTLRISAIDKKEGLRALKIMWRKIQQDDICSMLFCSLAFGKQGYSIWDAIGIGDLERYEKIRSRIKEKPYFSSIEEEQLKDGGRRKAELNRVCYGLWKLVVEQKRYNLNGLENFEPIEFYEEKEEFFNQLEGIVKKRAEVQDGIIYLELELEKEKIWSRLPKKAPYGRQGMYKNLRTKFPQLYENLLHISDNGIEPQVVEMIQEIRRFEVDLGESNKERNNAGRGMVNAGIVDVKVNESGRSLEERLYKLEDEMCGLKKENQELKQKIEELAYRINRQSISAHSSMESDPQNVERNDVSRKAGHVARTSKCDNQEWYRDHKRRLR